MIPCLTLLQLAEGINELKMLVMFRGHPNIVQLIDSSNTPVGKKNSNVRQVFAPRSLFTSPVIISVSSVSYGNLLGSYCRCHWKWRWASPSFWSYWLVFFREASASGLVSLGGNIQSLRSFWELPELWKLCTKIISFTSI